MKIGVIITAYNLEKYVSDAIRSALGQALRPNRILVIDDGSADDTWNRIKSFEGQVEMHRNERNTGVLPSTIHGIRSLNDVDVICLLDGDDVWMNNKLAEVSKEFASQPDAMMVTHRHQWIDADGRVLSVRDQTHSNLDRITRRSGTDRLQQDKLLKESILAYKGVWLGSALSFRRNCLNLEAFETWSLALAGHGLSHQDQPLAAYLIWLNPDKTIFYIDQALFQYRVFEANSSGASLTVPQALKTIGRSRATCTRTHDIVRQMPGRVKELLVQQSKLRELDYLENLYHRKYNAALGALRPLLFSGYWPLAGKAKELFRVIASIVITPERFLGMKSKRRF